MKKNDKVLFVEARIAKTQLAEMVKMIKNIVTTEWVTAENSGNKQPVIFCLCQQPEDESFIVCCDLCKQWFHGDCINLFDEY